MAPEERAPRIAIVGAGMAGIGTAIALQASEADVVVFEKSRGLSGRAASRRRDGVIYDHGANFIDLSAHKRVKALVEKNVPSDELVAVEGAIWTHDAEGQRSPGRESGQQRYSHGSGISRLGRALFESSTAALCTETHIAHVRRAEKSWTLHLENGNTAGVFDAVVLTPPAPQAARLVAAEPELDTLCAALEAVPYRAQFSVVLALRATLSAHAGIYAYLNTDGAHPVAWLSFESRKRGHVPPGTEVLIVQMAPEWTGAHLDEARETVAQLAQAEAEKLLGTPLSVAWWDVQRWRYALPDASLDVAATGAAEKLGLYVASDAVSGKGRVAGALNTGLETGARLARDLASGAFQQNTSVK